MKPRYTKGPRSSNRIMGRRNGFKRSSSYENNNSNRFKIKGNPSQVLNRYLILAKNALSTGDRIQAENYFQHADHFARVMSDSGIQFKINRSKPAEDNEEIENKDNNEKQENNTQDAEEILEDNSVNEKDEDSNEKDEDSNEKDEDSLVSVSFLSNPSSKKI